MAPSLTFVLDNLPTCYKAILHNDPSPTFFPGLHSPTARWMRLHPHIGCGIGHTVYFVPNSESDAHAHF